MYFQELSKLNDFLKNITNQEVLLFDNVDLVISTLLINEILFILLLCQVIFKI